MKFKPPPDLWLPKAECVVDYCPCPCHQEYRVRPDILGCMWGGDFRKHRLETFSRRKHYETQVLGLVDEEEDEDGEAVSDGAGDVG